MVKNYKKWHNQKSGIENKDTRVYFHEREIWFCHLGENIGFEQDGKGDNFGRPVVVFRKFNKEVFWAVPLSTKKKKGKFYFSLGSNDGVDRVAILSQIRLMDGKRLYQKMGVISKEEHEEMVKRIIVLCEI